LSTGSIDNSAERKDVFPKRIDGLGASNILIKRK